jgi:hypothetical protein
MPLRIELRNERASLLLVLSAQEPIWLIDSHFAEMGLFVKKCFCAGDRGAASIRGQDFLIHYTPLWRRKLA